MATKFTKNGLAKFVLDRTQRIIDDAQAAVDRIESFDEVKERQAHSKAVVKSLREQARAIASGEAMAPVGRYGGDQTIRVPGLTIPQEGDLQRAKYSLASAQNYRADRVALMEALAYDENDQISLDAADMKRLGIAAPEQR